MAKRILIVEDEPGYQELLAYLLREHELHLCASVEEAIPLIQIGGLDLIISDVNLLGMSGLSLLETAKGASRAVPIMFCTTYAEPEMRKQALAAGAAAFLDKPLDERAFLGVVRSLLQETPPPVMS